MTAKITKAIIPVAGWGSGGLGDAAATDYEDY